MDSTNDLPTRLVREAIRMLAENPDAVTLRGVARAAGVSAMAPYRHFADKAALMRAVADSGFTMLKQALQAADGAPDDVAALVGQGLAYVAFALAHPALFRLMFARPEDDSVGKDPGGNTAYSVLSRRIAQIAPDRAPVAVTAAWAIVHGLATLTLDARLPPGEDHARAVLSLFAKGLTAPPRQ